MTQNDYLPAEESLSEKTNVVLVLLKSKDLKSVIKNLNLDQANLLAIVTDGYDKKNFTVGDEKIPVIAFEMINSLIKKYKKDFWLISGSASKEKLLKLRKFLVAGGVLESNIRYFNVASKNPKTWFANFCYVKKFGADYFVTGNEYMQTGVNLNLIPTLTYRGVNLADSGQTLQQSYLTAKYVFEHVKPGTIKFVIIGLMPRSLRYDNEKIFLNTAQNLRYAMLFEEPTDSDSFIMNLFKINSKTLFEPATIDQINCNCDNIRFKRRKKMPVQVIADWQDPIKIFTPDDAEDNSQVLKDYVVLKKYIELCLANGAEPIGVVLPFAPIVRKNFDRKLLIAFREMIHKLEESHGFTCIDMFEPNLNYDCFWDMTYINELGQAHVNSLISFKLWQKKCLSTEDFCNMNYDYLSKLSRRVPKDEYNELLEQILKISVQKICRKDKIKLGFVLYDTSMWCGDDLYNYFARDERFESTIFLSMRVDSVVNAANEELFRQNLLHNAEQLKSHGLNVVTLDSAKDEVPEQDLLIFLTPYLKWVPNAFRLSKIKPTTLIAHIPYAFDTATRAIMCKEPIFSVLWKLFAPSIITLEMYENYCPTGVPNGVYSGYPKLDIFFKHDEQFHFEWKMARPDSKKIIYAPHWSINFGVNYATFQWNYKFMYEFAKAHPEISWVIKPHPNLMYSAVSSGLFSSTEDFKQYLQDWDNLPNALVYTGGYYQAIFATSDGMIHDSGSFSVEYQYVDKPMIYLTNNIERRDNLGQKILSVSYCVDGQDLDAIAATMQRVFIEGDDYKAEERHELFNEHLNYPKANGMLASEFIYKNISEGLMG